MEKLKLLDFEAEKIAPNFFNFLGERGSVKIGEEMHSVRRLGMSKHTDYHEGLGKPVYLNDEIIGEIEVYIDPPAIVFSGKIPDVPTPKGRGRRPLSPVDESGRRHVKVSFHYKHPKATIAGRGDGWTTIPLP